MGAHERLLNTHLPNRRNTFVLRDAHPRIQRKYAGKYFREERQHGTRYTKVVVLKPEHLFYNRAGEISSRFEGWAFEITGGKVIVDNEPIANVLGIGVPITKKEFIEAWFGIVKTFIEK